VVGLLSERKRGKGIEVDSTISVVAAAVAAGDQDLVVVDEEQSGIDSFVEIVGFVVVVVLVDIHLVLAAGTIVVVVIEEVEVGVVVVVDIAEEGVDVDVVEAEVGFELEDFGIVVVEEEEAVEVVVVVVATVVEEDPSDLVPVLDLVVTDLYNLQHQHH